MIVDLKAAETVSSTVVFIVLIATNWSFDVLIVAGLCSVLDGVQTYVAFKDKEIKIKKLAFIGITSYRGGFKLKKNKFLQFKFS